MNNVRPKKHLGQHFLTDLNIAQKIADGMTGYKDYQEVLEVGPGMGVLTDFLVKRQDINTHLIDIDKESIAYLHQKYPELGDHIIDGDFLKMDLSKRFEGKAFGLIGNFPYNISTQIYFKVLENRDIIPECVGMIQKEVAERIASKHGNKVYGILSVLIQAFYEVEYLFTVPPGVFNPPPKVDSAVIRLRRNEVKALDCDEKLFFRVVKQGFNNRRKTLRNSLKPLNLSDELRAWEMLDKRAEQLTVADFVLLTQKIEADWNSQPHSK
ncbi:16S rRNA (adenine(1518)-N(6)/adenine(1519)-N(6))-dimethyltransferase RsmA [Persicobacter sp. CCB-QB2]|uniref:16S rRNA (adenine(1518)-N(6)/adenine(1519)-N(6))- dimethyltransferase RsmA n=1 Tax=Persicobacter sp. CCB-QB2 TaxID=1561025 RepID=UPI0006A96DF5|nr:16S rRNA (adenine(1518)-N(6)/adenine(1519)-N(6))-dimethyltransferase RsmA [Persicobacter sp. CCB-QB2]